MINIDSLTLEDLAGMIDHTLLKAYVTREDIKRLCDEAVQYHFKSVAINGAQAAFCSEYLAGSGVICDATAGFPLGQSTIETKVFEAVDAINAGAGEVDYVVNLVELKSGDLDYVADEMRRMVETCHGKGAICKVIFENCYLTDEEKRELCKIALEVRPDYIKTSTGFGTGGAATSDVKLMRECVGDEIKIKAAGGIRTAKEALAMIEAGADRIGTSNGVQIVKEFKRLKLC